MKNKLTAFLLLIAAMASCRKDGNQTTSTSTSSHPLPLQYHPAEQAFPGIQGQVIGIQHGTDSIYVEKKGGYYVWMGDIILDEKGFKALQKPEGITTDNTFTEDPSTLWPSGQVFYTIKSGFSAAEQTAITDAMTSWQTNTPIRFTARTNQTNYVLIEPGATGSGFGSSGIGMTGGQQTISLESGNVNNPITAGVVMHEIGHTIGFFHEQCRADRGDWINVNYNFIYPNNSSNIYQYQTYYERNQLGWQISQLDFNSIMMYSSFDFLQPGTTNYPMTDLNGNPFFSQRDFLSAGDIATAFYMYHPVYVRVTYTTTDSEDDLTYVYNAGTVTANFYSDAAGTVPATLTYPLLLNIGVTSTNDCQSYVTENTNIIINAGNPGTVSIGQFQYTNTYDANEDPISCSSSTAGVAPGVGYWQIN
ncbi:M12 family metallopeptidase [Dinghuibacter silviterrae]|uniref:Astacin (Peptidase family M12A) n=1 Tax=Dinghuibacter silviterrae TaxID=1539049 RepID=A0A4R8DGE7_9BACT|nr:M12 family metallopeptidase [Dinghuibacter silviterrae]TDW96527.1 astacin (peptidase family M12A) [Dinghuibacter silviterrae]